MVEQDKSVAEEPSLVEKIKPAEEKPVEEKENLPVVSEEQPKKTSRWLKWLIITFVVVGLVFAIYFLFFNGDNYLIKIGKNSGEVVNEQIILEDSGKESEWSIEKIPEEEILEEELINEE